jgi:uncharacterized membrane protein
MTYLLLKWLHLIGAAVLFGTGLGIAFFTWFAYRSAMRSGQLALLQGVLTLTVIADALFTAVAAALLQPITGLFLWGMAGMSWRSPWLASVLGLYLFVGMCWLLWWYCRFACVTLQPLSAPWTSSMRIFTRAFACGFSWDGPLSLP